MRPPVLPGLLGATVATAGQLRPVPLASRPVRDLYSLLPARIVHPTCAQ
jgi:hypothetical protein